MSDRNGGDFVSGFLLGGLIGSAVALLMAPQTGEETREMLKEKGTEIKDKANESLEAAYARAETAATEARARADELGQLARQRAEELRDRGQVRGFRRCTRHVLHRRQGSHRRPRTGLGSQARRAHCAHEPGKFL